MSEIALEITTTVKPAKKMKLDGEEYQLLGLDHLSPADENRVMALFSRHSLLLAEQEATANVDKGTATAARVRSTRMDIICALTDIPKDVAETIPLGGQVKLLEKLQELMNDTDGDGESGDDG